MRLADGSANGVHRWMWLCDRCERVYSITIVADDVPGPTIAIAVVQLARLAGWDVRDAPGARARCAKCSRVHAV
jgi:hypothetical protein